MQHLSPYLNTSEGFTLSTINALYAEKQEEEEKTMDTSEDSQNGKGDDPTCTPVADFRVRICKSALSMNDIATICHSFAVRNDVFRPNWFNYPSSDKTSRMIFARINCTTKFMKDEFKKMNFMGRFFPPEGADVDAEVLSSGHFWKSMLHVNVDKFAQLKAIIERKGDSLKRLRYVNAEKRVAKPPPGFVKSGTIKGEPEREISASKNVRKVDLLTTMTQMIYLFYPIQGLEIQLPPGMPPIMKTKKNYTIVNEKSPLYFLDTEMCLTDVNLLELTRVTLLDENGNAVIDTFVKPYNRIVDYVTFYSGITKEAVNSTEVRVHDVQQAFRRVLPPDAIICGHSIEGDLRALRLSHPYCIDTTYVFNLSKFAKRTSLRGLAYFFLNKRIQCSGKGHCSYQDSLTVLRLIQLKLANPREFGITQFGFNYVEWAKANGLESCADFYEKLLVKDIAKDKLRPLELPKPREVGKCINCGTSQMSQCYVEDCECSEHRPKYCCMCVGKDVKHREPTGSEIFPFGKEIESVNKLSGQRIPLSVRLGNYQRGRVLVARYLKNTENMYALSGKTMAVFDMNSYDQIDVFKRYVLKANVFSSDLCLLEYNAYGLDADEVDKYVRTLYDEASSHSLIAVMFCSNDKAVFFSNTKIPIKEIVYG